jgi:predicted nuclease of predicted toxin-antitoxin system
MHFLANENFPLDAVEALRQNGHDVAWIRVDSPGISDLEVLNRAQAENRILLTFDKDFGELAFRSKLPATTGIILFTIKAQDLRKELAVMLGKTIYSKAIERFLASLRCAQNDRN